MVRAVITDVDGVIVGKDKGINFPLPNPRVIQKLKELQKRGIPVVLNTAKFNRAVLEIIKRAGLQNPHITDGGALIIDPLGNKIIKEYVLSKHLAKQIVKACVKQKFYTEYYGAHEGFLQKDQTGEFSRKRTSILQGELTTVDSVAEHIGEIDVIKIMPFFHKPEERAIIEQILEPFTMQVHVIFSHHPMTYPTQNAVITLKGVSKKTATLEVLKYLKIAPENALGVGDTLSDWNFISVCGYAGITGTHSQELLAHARSKGKGKYMLSSEVEKDGFLDLMNHFLG